MAKINYKGGQILTDARPDLHKTTFTLFAMVAFIYCATSSGAFGIESMISCAGPGLTVLLLLILPVLWGLPIGLYSAELGCLAPVESGCYVWMKLAFGEFWGFSMGLWVALASYLTGAAYVVLAVDYASMYIAFTPAAAIITKVLIIIVFTIINLMGLKEVSFVSNIFSILILFGFAAITVVGFLNWDTNPVEPFTPAGEGGLSSWGTGIAIGVWMYCGYVAVSFLGGEIANPQVIPKGMKIAILIITLSYILPTLAAVASTGPWTEWGVSLDWSSVLTMNLGTWAGVGFMIISVIAEFAIFNGSIATTSRSFMIMGEDNLAPKFLSGVTKNRKVPAIPILILAAINMVLINLDFTVLVTILSPVLFVLYVGLAFAFVAIRKKYPVEKRGELYCVKGGKLACIYIAGGPLLVGAISFVVNGCEYFLLGFIAIIVAVIFYIPIKIGYGGLYKKDPVQHPINPKTKLAKGDITRFGYFFLLFGAVCLVGAFFIQWYEGSWGPEYYLATYGSGLMSDFYLMIKVAKISGIIMLVIGLACFFCGKKFDPIPTGDEDGITIDVGTGYMGYGYGPEAEAAATAEPAEA